MVDRAGSSNSATDAWWERNQNAARADTGAAVKANEVAGWLKHAAATSTDDANAAIPASPSASLSPDAIAHLSGKAPAAPRAALGPEMVPFAKLQTRAQLDAAIAREHLFLNTLGAWAAPEELRAHQAYLGGLLRAREAGSGTAPERLRARDQRDIESLRAQLATLGDTSGCRRSDTAESLTRRVQALTAERALKKDEKDGERLNIGLDGRSGTRDGLDDYETVQWVAAANPGSGTGVIFAAAATMRGGSLEDVRAAGQLGNHLEEFVGGEGAVLNAERGAVKVEAKATARASSAARVDDFNAGGAFPTKPMIGRYAADPARGKLGEHQPGNQIWKTTHVEYLTTEAQRAPFKLEVREVEIAGRMEIRLFDTSGELFDTRSANTLWSNEKGAGRAIFVMNARGELFASKHQALGEFHHSSLAGGQPVAAAGELHVIEGKLVAISNCSGHYLPGDEQTDQALHVLRAMGMDLSGVHVLEMASGTTRVLR